jgi:hypothetical protein
VEAQNRDVLLREMQHRVKNSFQLILASIAIQKRRHRGPCMIRRTLSGLAVFALVAGLSGVLTVIFGTAIPSRLQGWDSMESTSATWRAKQVLRMTYGVTEQPAPPKSVVSTIFRTFDQATASVCTTCG